MGDRVARIFTDSEEGSVPAAGSEWGCGRAEKQLRALFHEIKRDLQERHGENLIHERDSEVSSQIMSSRSLLLNCSRFRGVVEKTRILEPGRAGVHDASHAMSQAAL